MTSYFKAVHSTGTVHLRASKSRPDYTFCVVGPRIGAISCHRTRELADKQLAVVRQWHSDHEVVPLVEIERAEYAALKKASKRSYKVLFLGKTYTKTRNADQKPIVGAVGHKRDAYTSRHPVHPNSTPEVKARYPEGFWTVDNREYIRVEWFDDQAKLDAYAAGEKVPGWGGTGPKVGVDHVSVVERLPLL